MHRMFTEVQALQIPRSISVNRHVAFVCAMGMTVCAAVIGERQLYAGEIRQPLGFYVMQAVHNQNVKDSVIANPKLTGFHVRDEWQLIEKTSNNYDWSWIDGQLARANRLNKQVTLGIYTGNNSPTWLGVPRVDNVPIPWDPKVVAEHAQMVAQLGAKYANHPRVDAVHISGTTTSESLEMFYPDGLKNVAGYSDQNVLNSWKSAIDAYGAAFPNNSLILNLAIIPKWPTATITHQVIDYAQAKLGDRATFQVNSLKARWDSSKYQPPDPRAVAPAHLQLIYDLAEEGEWVGWEMVGPSNDANRFKGPFEDAIYLGELADPQYYQIYASDVPRIPNGITFGPPSGLASGLSLAAVPEPSTAALAAIFVCCASAVRHSRFRQPRSG